MALVKLQYYISLVSLSSCPSFGCKPLWLGGSSQYAHEVLCHFTKEADTDENQGSLDFEEFCSFYKMISTRRDLYLIMISYSNQKEVMDLQDLARFLENEQKVQKNLPF